MVRDTIHGIRYEEADVNQAIRCHRFIDNWFPVRYSLNPYSGCEYGCRYCRVNWKKEKTVITKTNFLEKLTKELPGFPSSQIVGVGGGYNDVFGPINDKTRMSEEVILELLRAGHRPLIMTKNPGYALGLLGNWLSFPENQRPILITSISGGIDADHFQTESGVPSLEERLSAVKELSASLKVGVAFLPWLVENGEKSLADLMTLMERGKRDGWSFTLLGYLQGLVKGKKLSGKALSPPKLEVGRLIQKHYLDYSQKLSLWPRLPPKELSGCLSLKDEITVLLAYLYYLGWGEKRKAFRMASLGINALSETEFEKIRLADQLDRITGVGPVISEVIRDFFRSGKANYFTNNWKKIGY